MDPEIFHKHLDVCKQCREHPFNLCPIGKAKLVAAGTQSAAMVSEALDVSGVSFLQKRTVT